MAKSFGCQLTVQFGRTLGILFGIATSDFNVFSLLELTHGFQAGVEVIPVPITFPVARFKMVLDIEQPNSGR